MLHDYDDLWALQLQPHRKGFSYQRHLFVYYRALQRLGIPVDIISQDADLSRYKLVIAPTIFVSDSMLADKLAAYVQGGGNILYDVRTGFKTESNLVTDRPLPRCSAIWWDPPSRHGIPCRPMSVMACNPIFLILHPLGCGLKVYSPMQLRAY